MLLCPLLRPASPISETTPFPLLPLDPSPRNRKPLDEKARDMLIKKCGPRSKKFISSGMRTIGQSDGLMSSPLSSRTRATLVHRAYV